MHTDQLVNKSAKEVRGVLVCSTDATEEGQNGWYYQFETAGMLPQ
jgi:hypothetical protein